MANKTVDLSAHPVDLDGKAFDETFGRLIAEHVLAKSSDGPPMKCWEWAQALYKGDSLSLDSTDMATLYGLVASNRVLTNMIKCQTMILLDGLK